LIETERLRADDTPVAKIERRKRPVEGSKGAAVWVSESRMIASPAPSPLVVKMPGAPAAIMVSAFDEKPSEFVTTISAGPTGNPSGTTKITSPGLA
jgi:hypothetical protein